MCWQFNLVSDCKCNRYRRLRLILTHCRTHDLDAIGHYSSLLVYRWTARRFNFPCRSVRFIQLAPCSCAYAAQPHALAGSTESRPLAPLTLTPPAATKSAS